MSRTVLVVDDDEDLREVTVDLLRARGYDADGAEDGAAALERIRAAGVPAVILLDMRMPVMNGWQFARVFREHHDRSAPIVVVTAASDAHRSAKEVEADGWLSKPFDPDELLAAVEERIGEP
jgi:CheY-like chemotaxis protein